MPGPVSSRPYPAFHRIEPGIELTSMQQRPVEHRMPKTWDHIAKPVMDRALGPSNAPVFRGIAGYASENTRDGIDSAWAAVEPHLAELREEGLLDAFVDRSLGALKDEIHQMAPDASAAFVRSCVKFFLRTEGARLAGSGAAGKLAIAGLERLVQVPDGSPAAATAEEIVDELTREAPLTEGQANAFLGAALRWSGGGCVNLQEMRDHLCAAERAISEAVFDALVQDPELMRKWNADLPGPIDHLIAAECPTPDSIKPTLRAARALPLRVLELTIPADRCVVDLRGFEGMHVVVVLHVAPPRFAGEIEEAQNDDQATPPSAAAVGAPPRQRCIVYLPPGVDLRVPSVQGMPPNVFVHDVAGRQLNGID